MKHYLWFIIFCTTSLSQAYNNAPAIKVSCQQVESAGTYLGQGPRTKMLLSQPLPPSNGHISFGQSILLFKEEQRQVFLQFKTDRKIELGTNKDYFDLELQSCLRAQSPMTDFGFKSSRPRGCDQQGSSDITKQNIRLYGKINQIDLEEIELRYHTRTPALQLLNIGKDAWTIYCSIAL